MSKRWIATLILVAAAPAALAAQFTTFIAPPNQVKDSIKAAVVAEQKASTDSVTRAQIADMKTWVDSAAGIAVPASDTMYRVKTITAATAPATAAVMTAQGMVAPATASSLPLLLAMGGAAMLLGLALMRRPRPAPRRADSR